MSFIIMTQSIDLSHTFSDNMPVFPGDPRAELHQIAEFHSARLHAIIDSFIFGYFCVANIVHR